MAFQEIKSNDPGTVVAFGEPRTRIVLCDVRSASVLCDVRGKFCAHGGRLAISPQGDLFVAANYQTGNVSLWTCNGRRVWERRVTNPQYVSFTHEGDRVFCGQSSRNSVEFKTESGAILEESRFLRTFTSRFGDVRCLEHTGSFDLVSGGTNMTIHSTKRILSTAFSSSHAVISQSGGDLFIVELESGQIAHHHRFDGSHYLELSYNVSHEQFLGTKWSLVEGGLPHVCNIDPLTGKIGVLWTVPSPLSTFADNGACLVIDSAEVCDSWTGERISQLPAK